MVRFINSANRSLFVRALIMIAMMAILIAPSNLVSASQDEKKEKPQPAETQRKEDGKVPNEKELEKDRKKQEKAKAEEPKLTPVEALLELTIIAYGGRKQLQTVRAAIQEEGTIRLATDQGDITGSYNLRSKRSEKSWQDLLRIDLELTPPGSEQRQGGTIKYVIAFNGGSVWSAQNNQYVSPRPEAEASFRAQLTHDYTTLLRYKEDGSKVELLPPETVVGVLANVVEMATPDGEKTRYWISAKTYRIIHAEYELKMSEAQTPTKFRVSYYYVPFRVVQNTLVPVRRVMTQDGKFVQEINLTNITYSAKLEAEIFQHLQG